MRRHFHFYFDSVLQLDGQSNFCVTSFLILSTIQIQIVVMIFQVRLQRNQILGRANLQLLA